MLKTRRFLLLSVIVVILGSLGYKLTQVVWENQLRQLRQNPIEALNYLPESALRIKDFRRAKVQDGRTLWELLGDEASYNKDQKQARVSNPRFLYYGRKGEVAEASAEVAHIFLNERELEKMELEGGIEVIFNGYTLRSEEAVYLPAKEQIIMPQRTTVNGDGLELEGARMEVDLGESKVRLLRNVKTRLEPQKLNEQRSRAERTGREG